MTIKNIKYLNYQVYNYIVAMDKESKATHQECENICFCPLKGIIDVIREMYEDERFKNVQGLKALKNKRSIPLRPHPVEMNDWSFQ